MRFYVFPLLLAMFLFSMPATAQEKREWKFCEQDSECVVVGGGCCLSAVNKDFAKQGKEYCDKINAVTECFRYMDPAKSKAVCKQTPVPCMNNSPEGCLSKRKKCALENQEVLPQ